MPLNTLSLDTDWKAPNNWDGWEWNTDAVPPSRARSCSGPAPKDIDVTLNIHSSIAVDDPKVPTAQQHRRDRRWPRSSCMAGICKVWDWSSVPQAESNFALQQSFEEQGVAFWWLDWCCDASVVSMPGLTPDAWIGHLYAQEMVNQGQRGFVLARIGSSNGNPQRVYPAGPWSDHTSAIAFTGDAWGTWNTLAQEVALTPDEATIGEPYVSDDIGSFLGPPPGQPWIRPISTTGGCSSGPSSPSCGCTPTTSIACPGSIPQPVRAITDDLPPAPRGPDPLHLHARRAGSCRPVCPWRDPSTSTTRQSPAAYAHPEEYLYGSDMLVAPVTSPGRRGQHHRVDPAGPLGGLLHRRHLQRSHDHDAGGAPEPHAGLRPRRRDHPRAASSTPPSLAEADRTGSSRCSRGPAGRFSVYADSGTGLGYTKGQYTETPITDTVGPGQHAPPDRLPRRPSARPMGTTPVSRPPWTTDWRWWISLSRRRSR